MAQFQCVTPTMSHNADHIELLSLRSVLESLGAFVYTKDREGRYLYANGLVCELFGRPLDQVVGRKDDEFFDPEETVLLYEHDRRVIDGGEVIEAEEVNLVRTTGETRIYWSIKAPVRDASGAIVGLCGISNDVTERRALERRLEAHRRTVEEQRLLLNTVLDNIDASVYMKRRDRTFLYVNRQCATLFGRTPEEVVGKHETEILPTEMADHFSALDVATFETQAKQTGEEEMLSADGRTHHFWSIKVPLTHLGRPDELIGFSTDITELHMLRRDLEHQAYVDHLTGVASRGYFVEQASHQLLQAKRYGHRISLLAFDLDHFKQVNDAHGHAGGDAVLIEVVRACVAAVRESDLIGRIGGEEFAILLPDTDLAAATGLGERLCATVRDLEIPLPGSGVHLRQTMSVGVATFEAAAGDDFDRLMARADGALYEAKRAGRDRVRVAAGTALPGDGEARPRS